MKTKKKISIKSENEVKILRDAGKILSEIIKDLKNLTKAGMSTQDVDNLAEELIKKSKVKPAFKGYRGFPGCICISVNEQVVHGIPGTRILKESDIVSIDVGIIHQDYYSDTAITLALGSVSPEIKRLLDVTKTSLHKGIEKAFPGNHLYDISYAIQKHVEDNDLCIVRDFVGHGIGKNLHEDPEIPNFGQPHQGPLLKEGMVFAIEPMVNLGSWKVFVNDDGWTVSTEDGQPSAHFEHSIVITKNGPEILTE